MGVLNTSPFFGQVASGQAQSSPTVSSQRDAQKNLLVELGLAYSGLEGFDEAASVGQAQLGTQMQSQLKNLLDIAADTPRPLGSPTNSGYLSPQAWSCPASSPKVGDVLISADLAIWDWAIEDHCLVGA
eukprot:s7360_g1.t1